MPPAGAAADGAAVPPGIRRARPEDLPALLCLVEEFYRVDPHTFVRDVVAGALAPLLPDDAHGQVWVVDRAGGLAGYAVLTWGWSLESGGRDCLLDELFVRDRGAGTGTALLQHVLREAVAAGARVVFLETEAHNDRARAFYGRAGFEAEDSVWMSARHLRRTLPPAT